MHYEIFWVRIVANEMDVLIWVSLAIFAVVIVVAIIAKLMLGKKREKEEAKKIDYQAFVGVGFSFFSAGVVFMILGLTSDFPVALGISFFGLGLIYLVLGLTNRNRGKEKRTAKT